MGKDGGCVPEGGGREGVRAAGADVHPLGGRGVTGGEGSFRTETRCGGVTPTGRSTWGSASWPRSSRTPPWTAGDRGS